MRITEVEVFLTGNEYGLLADARMTFDDVFVVHGVRVVRVPDDGRLIVCMPSRQKQDECPDCGAKVPYRNDYCGKCGAKLGRRNVPADRRGATRIDLDIVHPISRDYREYIDYVILEAYQKEFDRGKAERAQAGNHPQRAGGGTPPGGTRDAG